MQISNCDFIFVNIKYKYSVELIRRIEILGGKVNLIKFDFCDFENNHLDDQKSLITNFSGLKFQIKKLNQSCIFISESEDF